MSGCVPQFPSAHGHNFREQSITRMSASWVAVAARCTPIRHRPAVRRSENHVGGGERSVRDWLAFTTMPPQVDLEVRKNVGHCGYDSQ